MRLDDPMTMIRIHFWRRLMAMQMQVMKKGREQEQVLQTKILNSPQFYLHKAVENVFSHIFNLV